MEPIGAIIGSIFNVAAYAGNFFNNTTPSGNLSRNISTNKNKNKNKNTNTNTNAVNTNTVNTNAINTNAINTNTINTAKTKTSNLIHPGVKSTSKYVNKLYDQLSYYDMYGSTIMVFILLTLFVFYIYTYYKVLQIKEEVANDWSNQRCNPKYIPFAGYITHPDGTTPFDYTAENFQFCIQSIENDVTGSAVQPFNYLINASTGMLNIISEAIQKIREFLNLLRKRIRKFAEDVLHKILNVMIPLQSVIIALMDSFHKIEGTMTAGLYTMLGGYFTLKSLMGAIVELLVKMLIVMVILIAGLWAVPFSWPAAGAASAVFLAISIPLAIIVLVMTEVLHVKSSGIPKLCFDKNTLFTMDDGQSKKIIDIRAGDLLENGVIVTAKFKIDASSQRMFILNNVIVSESHIIKYMDQWIPVRDHPLAKELLKAEYKEPFIYCLNTSTKEIVLNGLVLTDWDEIYEDTLTTIINAVPQNIFTRDLKVQKENIHRYLDVGFESLTTVYLFDGSKKQIKDVKIGDKLSTKGIVYGTVEIENENENEIANDNILGNNTKENLYHLLVSNKYFETDGKIIGDYNDMIDSILKAKL